MPLATHDRLAERPAAGLNRDEGIGLIEVVVAMFMLALLAVALLPLLLQGVKQSASTATSATGTQLLNEQVELMRSLDPRCALITSATATVTDARGVKLRTTRVADPCPAAYPGTVRVRATVTRLDTGAVIGEASTRVFVTGA